MAQPVLDSAAQLNEVVAQVILSGLIVYSLEFIKKSELFPWITAEKKKLQRCLSMIIAALTAIGIHYQYDAATTQFVITGSLVGIRHAVWEWGKQLVLQQMIYDGVIPKQEAK